MLIHGRNGAFALVVAALALFLTPALASAHHDLVIYKAEQHVDLESDEKEVSVSCNAGDYALDGMWRIDHADQDDYVPALDLITSAVDVLKATPTSDSTYSFKFVKNAIGRAQVKVFVTCLGQKTQGGSHQHAFATAFVDDAGAALPANTYDSANTNVTGHPTDYVKNQATATCPTGTILVSPGFEAHTLSGAFGGDSVAGMMRLYESNTTTSPRDWSWRWENSALPDATYTFTVTTKFRCLKIKVPPTGFDKHKLVAKWKNAVSFEPKKKKVSEGQYHCGSHYKAIVAGFTIHDGAEVAGTDSNYFKDGTGLKPVSMSWGPPAHEWNNIFFLGMDPRPKTRAYRFANRSSTTTWPVTLRATCINDRTT